MYLVSGRQRLREKKGSYSGRKTKNRKRCMKLLCRQLIWREREVFFTALFVSSLTLPSSLLLYIWWITQHWIHTSISLFKWMDFEEQEETELGIPERASYNDLAFNSYRVKMSSHNSEEEPVAVAMAVTPLTVNRNNNKGRYKECLKNHAIGIGGHALDGCGEFMAAGTEGTIDALRCAACNCHRNFHHKEVVVATVATIEGGYVVPYHRCQGTPQFTTYCRALTGSHHVAGNQRATLALPSKSGGCGGTYSLRDDQEDVLDLGGVGGSNKKRFRTKFTQEQKDKMLKFAEKLGWRIEKHDSNVIQEFCSQTGIQRNVLKVWMHNNKHTLGKKL